MRISKAQTGRRAGINVSQALARIRKVARERKKDKFTALFHHLNVDLLKEAFFALKRALHPAWID